MIKKIKHLFCVVAILFLYTSLVYAAKSTEYLKYADETVRLDIYNPGYGSCPVAILIHGASGIQTVS